MFQALRGSLCARGSTRQKHPKRLVNKDGRCNVEYGRMKLADYFSYLLDIWSTSVDIRWHWFTLSYVATFIFSWFIFTLLWYWVAYSNQDLWWQTPPANHSACVLNVYDLTTAYLFSVETQLTIGYGFRVMTPLCPGAIAVFAVQILVGMVICCFWCGVLMAKVSLPANVARAVTFSRVAVVGFDRGELRLQIRVANLRRSLLLGGRVYGKLVRSHVSSEGGAAIVEQVDVDLGVDGGNENLFFAGPLELYHVVDEFSPFSGACADPACLQDLELVVFLDGTAEATSSACQVRTSYLPQEILWGHRFLPITSRSEEGKYRVDFSNFERVEPEPSARGGECLSVVGIENKSFEVIEIGDG